MLMSTMSSLNISILSLLSLSLFLLKFKFNRFLNLHNPHIASLIEEGCVTYNKIHYKFITLQIHCIIVKCRKKSISISIRKELMIMLMSRLSSLAHKLLMLMFMLMLASLVRTLKGKSTRGRHFFPYRWELV